MPAPESFFEVWELTEQTSCRYPLQNLHSISNRNRWRNTQKQVDVIRLYLFRENGPLALGANPVKNFLNGLRNRSDQYVVAILWAPDHMVSSLVDTVSVISDFRHTRMVLKIACSGSPPFLSRLKSGVSWRTFYERHSCHANPQQGPSTPSAQRSEAIWNSAPADRALPGLIS